MACGRCATSCAFRRALLERARIRPLTVPASGPLRHRIHRRPAFVLPRAAWSSFQLGISPLLLKATLLRRRRELSKIRQIRVPSLGTLVTLWGADTLPPGRVAFTSVGIPFLGVVMRYSRYVGTDFSEGHRAEAPNSHKQEGRKRWPPARIPPLFYVQSETRSLHIRQRPL